MNNKTGPQILTGIRLPEALLKRIDKLARGMTIPGMPATTRSDVLRLAALKGVEYLETEQKKR